MKVAQNQVKSQHKRCQHEWNAHTRKILIYIAKKSFQELWKNAGKISVKEKLNESLSWVMTPKNLTSKIEGCNNQVKQNESFQETAKKEGRLSTWNCPLLQIYVVRVFSFQTRGFILYLIRYHMAFLSIYSMFLKVKTAGKWNYFIYRNYSFFV